MPKQQAAISMVVLALASQVLSGEEAVDLHATIRELAEARASIKSYELSVAARVQDDPRPVKNTLGETVTPRRKLVAFTIDFANDAASESFLVARRDRFEDLATGVQTTEDWRIYATTPEWSLQGRRGEAAILEKTRRVEKPKYFDPLGLGLAFEGEYHRGDSWQTIVGNYLKWQQGQAERLDDGMLRFGDRVINPQVVIEIDPARDYWPVRHQRSSTNSPFLTELKLQRMHERWLPHKAHVKSRRMEADLRFSWHSLDSQVQSRFQVADIQTRYAVEVSDNR